MAMITGTWAERCAADTEARDWAMEYGRVEFYYSEKWGALTAVADGTTTLTDIADAIAAGTATPYEEALAAHYFARAADYLLYVEEGRVAGAVQGHPVPALEDDNGQVPWLVDDSELAAAEYGRDYVAALRDQAHEVAREAVAREDDARRWDEAADENAYHAAGAAAAVAADVNDAWRKAVDVEYDQRCADYGNDGRPEDDRHISREDKAAQAAAVAAITERTGLPTGAVWDAVRDVTDLYARDHTDTATLGQPDWDQVADSWAALMDQNRADSSGSEVPAWEREADQAAYWDELGESHPAVRDSFWTSRDALGLTAADDIDRVELNAAYEEAGDAIVAAAALAAAEPGADAHNLALAPAWTEDDAYVDEMHAEYFAREAAERAERQAQGPTSAAWRTAAAITYREHVIEDYGNDGRPEDDLHLSASEVAARAAAITTIAEATGVPDGYVYRELRAAAVVEGAAPGADNDPDYLAPPNWETFVEQYNQYETDSVALAFEGGPDEDRADDVGTGAQPDTGQAAPSIETAEYWLARGEVDPGAGLSEEMPPEWSPETSPQWPVEPRWTSEAGQARLEAKWAAEDAAYAAEQARIAALPADERQDRAIESVAGLVVDAAPAASADGGKLYASASEAPAASLYWGDWDQAHVDDLITGRGTAEERRAWMVPKQWGPAPDAELADALDQARARLAAGDVPEADRAAHEARIEQLEAETTQPYPQEYSAADDPYDHELHHGGGADLPPVPSEYTEHPDAYRSGPISTSTSDEVPVLPGSWGGPSSGITAGMSPADMHAAIEEQLGQARVRLQAGDTSPEWVREQAEYVEHLEEWAYVTGEFAADRFTGDELGKGITDAPLVAVEDTAAADRVSGRDPAMWGREPSSGPDVSGESYAVDPRLLATAEAIAEALRGGDLDGAQRLQAALYDDRPPADTASVPGDAATVEDTDSRRGGWEGWSDHWDQERDAGESPGKSQVAEAVAAAHAAVEADSQRAAEELGEQQQPSRAGDRARTDAVEQAPAMEWGA